MCALLFSLSKLLFFFVVAFSFFVLPPGLVEARSGSSQSSSPTKSPESWGVAEAPARLVNGSPVLFRVAAPRAVRALSGKWLGHEIVFSFDAERKDWFALAGVSQETKPGSYSLELRGETSTPPASGSSSSSSSPSPSVPAGRPLNLEKKILIGRQRYPRVLLKVPGKYTAPSPEDQKEIAAAKEVKAEIFKTVTTAREWRGSFVAPVKAEISDVFGVERVFNGSVQSTHQGLDFRVPSGTAVAAVNDGTVILARPLFFEGNCIVIDHGQGLLTLYLHLSKFLVKEGDAVKKGQEIGLSGGTGRATGPHLHLAVRWQGVYLNPAELLKLTLP
jgi:murein DD-endopeptidase MepM/ murein hydrolase activator NlpD